MLELAELHNYNRPTGKLRARRVIRLQDLTSAACRLSTRARRSRTTRRGAFSQPAELQLLDYRIGSVPDDSARFVHAFEVEATKRRHLSV